MCDLCNNVNAAQTRCTCSAPCGAKRGCYYVEPDEFVPPPVPQFRSA